MARHRSFSSEFKRQLAREFLEGHAGMHELARRYSLSRNLIRLWVRKYEAGEFTDEMAEAVRIAEYEHKIAERQLTMEVDLLKNGARLGRAGNDANYALNLLLPLARQGNQLRKSSNADSLLKTDGFSMYSTVRWKLIMPATLLSVGIVFSVFGQSNPSASNSMSAAGDPMKQAGSDIADPKRRTLEVFDNE